MRPKGYPACVLLSFVIAASFLGIGRVALCGVCFARTKPSSVENPWQGANDSDAGAETPRLPGLAATLKVRPPSSIAPFGPNLTSWPKVSRDNCGSRTSAARTALTCGADVVAEARTYKDTQSRTRASDAHTSAPATFRATAGVGAANFSSPITFEPAGGTAGQAVQYVGRGKGMTVLLESGGIEITVGSAASTNTTPTSVQLRLVNSGVAQSTVSGLMVNGGPSAPPSHRKRRRGPASKPRTHRRRNRQNMPRRDTPGHAGQTPRGQRAPKQRIPRQTKPSGQLETPPPNDGSGAANFAWQGVTPLEGESNCFLGSDPAKWRMHVRHFAAAEAKDVLPGVGIVAYGNAEGAEYDLRIAPGVDAGDLRLEIAGTGAARSQDVRLDASGDLLITLEGRELRTKKPAIYEEWAATESHPLRRKQIDGGWSRRVPCGAA